ncbi:hypothetical protein [Micromonospora globbae]|nr:hypothetical protein [Micromonospora globbae]
MRLRVARVALAVVTVGVTAGCGAGQADAGGGAGSGLPKTPEESYAMVMEALFTGDSQRVCTLMTPDAAKRFVTSMIQWNDASGTTCEGVVDSFASKQTGPPPEERGIKLHGTIEYPNENFAKSPGCPKDANGEFRPNFARLTWKKEDGGWIITEFNALVGCGG